MTTAGAITLGTLGTVFFTLLWRRLGRVITRLDRIGARLEDFHLDDVHNRD